MNKFFDLDAILKPIDGENPAGENLRYSPVYDEIIEARREDDILDRGDWGHEIKTADWEKVIKLSTQVLSKQSKDLQIAAWLMEAFVITHGFNGVKAGLKIVRCLLRDFWENLYPEIEDNDLDYRAGPIEFMNDKLWARIKQIPITDHKVTPGYSWLQWQESNKVGREKDTHNRYGDVDDDKKKARDELIAEGKITAEEFEDAVLKSSYGFYNSLFKTIQNCRQEFNELDELIDQKFGKEAPRLAELRQALEDCEMIVTPFFKAKKKNHKEEEPTIQPEEPPEEEAQPTVQDKINEPAVIEQTQEKLLGAQKEEVNTMPSKPSVETPVKSASSPVLESPPAAPPDQTFNAEFLEKAIWKDALKLLKSSGIKKALKRLLDASYGAPSVRERTRYRLLMAKLCLKAERPDLARPIMEELNTLIEELNLVRWESPLWIAEVMDALYKCLTADSPTDDDKQRANGLFQKICTMDVTKAMIYRN